MNKLPDKENLRPDEVATYFEVSVSTIYREMDLYVDTLGSEGLPFFNVRGQKRIKRKDVIAYSRRKPWTKTEPVLPFDLRID